MASGDLVTEFAGRRGPLFGLAFKSAILTVLTLGIYRFWMKTRLRRYYWSSVRPGGHPLEYVGEPIEKLLGFLIAVVVLAFYIGVVNLILMFLSFAILNGNIAAYILSFIGVIPIWFYALYRARRYVLARTRWRGLRFGLEPGAWGYAWRVLAHWAVTILSLGLLWPRMTFWLEKYKTDRTSLGDLRLHQGGRWQGLYPAYGPMFLFLVVSILSVGMSAAGRPEFLPVAVIAALFLPWAFVLYRVKSLKYLTNNKSAGGLGLTANPRTGRIFAILVGGYLMIGVVLGALSVLLGIIVAVRFGIGFAVTGDLDVSAGLGTITGLIVYFLIFVFWVVLRHVWITLPTWRHYAETLEVTGAYGLGAVNQRARDEFQEAEGFAEALDLGAAI